MDIAAEYSQLVRGLVETVESKIEQSEESGQTRNKTREEEGSKRISGFRSVYVNCIFGMGVCRLFLKPDRSKSLRFSFKHFSSVALPNNNIPLAT